MDSTKRDFIFKDIRNTLVHARACDEIWWNIEGTNDDRELIIEGCNRYIDFFETVRSSMFLSFVILLGSLFDERDDSISLISIPEIKGEDDFEDLWQRGRKLYKYRSKSIAHRDVHSDSIDYAAATGFTYNQVRSILLDSLSIYDRIAQREGRITVESVNITPGKDFMEVMKNLV